MHPDAIALCAWGAILAVALTAGWRYERARKREDVGRLPLDEPEET